MVLIESENFTVGIGRTGVPILERFDATSKLARIRVAQIDEHLSTLRQLDPISSYPEMQYLLELNSHLMTKHRRDVRSGARVRCRR
jgi:hypothetical protein